MFTWHRNTEVACGIYNIVQEKDECFRLLPPPD